ncbi:MAG: hypothetical protein HS113_20605 [Verrucomicrobiales bacterium]|nr:hypothetical protein [Verrucomicrobiales bacterium]
MKTRTVHLRARPRATIRERESVEAIQPGELAIVDGVPYIRTPAGDLIELAVAGE